MQRARFSRARSRMLALAASGVMAFGALPAEGSQTIELRARSTNGAGDVISPDGKSVTVNAVGTKVTLDVFSVITGENSVQVTGEFGGTPFDGLPDTRNDDAAKLVTGSFRSDGSLLGDLAAFRVAPFTGPGSSDGIQADIDGDGDLDVGRADTQIEGMFSARSGNPTFATIIDGGPEMSPPESRIIDATTSVLLIGQLEWTIAPSSGSADILFLPRMIAEGGSSTWYEDDPNSMNVKTPGNGSYLAGPPVTVTLVPEPGAVGLLGAVSLVLLRRRRRGSPRAE